jgi:hypothetical protein
MREGSVLSDAWRQETAHGGPGIVEASENVFFFAQFVYDTHPAKPDGYLK